MTDKSGAATPAFIELSRTAGPQRDAAAVYDVVIDGETVAALTAGGSHSFPVAPGEHAVRMEIDWCRSRTLALAVAPGETVRLVCGPRGAVSPTGTTGAERFASGLATLFQMFARHRDYIDLARLDGGYESGPKT